ncbi:hypothetical protein [Caballeronia sp. ATUFL_M2_KS44]|uniref:hypothetical protein n=1 Tax=Caballeronia sp. ATUFL_M2_KS44 TaxID=2921767 RepID=UPI002028FAB2|nr:hypothetical protein [Caballeronia sp. ATUFL_M2_KS44]
MIDALLETVGALSVLASVAAKIAWMREHREDVADRTASPTRRPQCARIEHAKRGAARYRRCRQRDSARVAHERR